MVEFDEYDNGGQSLERDLEKAAVNEQQKAKETVLPQTADGMLNLIEQFLTDGAADKREQEAFAVCLRLIGLSLP